MTQQENGGRNQSENQPLQAASLKHSDLHPDDIYSNSPGVRRRLDHMLGWPSEE